MPVPTTTIIVLSDPANGEEAFITDNAVPGTAGLPSLVEYTAGPVLTF